MDSKIPKKESELSDMAVQEREKKLEGLLSAVTPGNIHDECGFGEPVGDEVW